MTTTNAARNNVMPIGPTSSEKSAEFYRELTHRNRHFVKPETQTKLKNLKVLIAGCGAAGGACIEPLARIGVTQFKLADNGSYELSNLNRQHTFVDFIGVNKAVFHAQELKRINPFIDVETFPEGVSRANLPRIINWADIIIDAVDVTTEDAIQLKFHLHELASSSKKPVLSPLDPGFCQCGIGWDYRDPSQLPLDGRLALAKGSKNPIKALLHMLKGDRFSKDNRSGSVTNVFHLFVRKLLDDFCVLQLHERSPFLLSVKKELSESLPGTVAGRTAVASL